MSLKVMLAVLTLGKHMHEFGILMLTVAKPVGAYVWISIIYWYLKLRCSLILSYVSNQPRLVSWL